MQIKYLAIGFSILVFSCGLLETDNENNNLDMVPCLNYYFHYLFLRARMKILKY